MPAADCHALRYAGFAATMKRGVSELDKLLKNAAKRKEKIKGAEEILATEAARKEQQVCKESAPEAAAPKPSDEPPPPISFEVSAIGTIFTLPVKPCIIESLVAEAESECAGRQTTPRIAPHVPLLVAHACAPLPQDASHNAGWVGCERHVCIPAPSRRLDPSPLHAALLPERDGPLALRRHLPSFQRRDVGCCCTHAQWAAR